MGKPPGWCHFHGPKSFAHFFNYRATSGKRHLRGDNKLTCSIRFAKSSLKMGSSKSRGRRNVEDVSEDGARGPDASHRLCPGGKRAEEGPYGRALPMTQVGSSLALQACTRLA